MAGTPSSGACARCKARHVKCDEGQPSCQRCLKAKKPCPGYVKVTKFLDEGKSLRRKYGSDEGKNGDEKELEISVVMTENMVRQDDRISGELQAGGDEDLVDETSSDVEMVPPETFGHITNPEQIGQQSKASLPPSAMSGYHETSRMTTNALSQVQLAQDLERDSSAFGPGRDATLGITHHINPGFGALSFLGGPQICDPPHSLTHSIQYVFSQSHEPRSSFTESLQSGKSSEVDNDHEMLFLLRHFVEVIGPWYVEHNGANVARLG
jgi:Fungal Zn(2)-Cys(6) binuclear cluster domain